MTSILLPPTSSSLPSIFSQHDNSTSDPLSKLGNTIVDRKMAESVSASTATQQAQQQQQNTTTTQPSAQALSPLVSGLVANLTSASENQRCLWEGCNDRFGSAEELYEHICGVHIGRKSTNNLQLVCRWSNCNTTTVKRDHITSHVRVHVPFKPHRCPVCGKSFKRPQDLKKHHKTHAEENSQGQNGHSHGPNGHGSNGANGYGMNGGGGAGSFYGGAGMHNGAAMQFPYTGQNGGGYYQQPAAMSNAYNQAMYYNPDVGAGPGVAYGRRDDDLQAINNLFGTIKQPNFNAASYPQFQSSLAHAHGLILPPPINTHSMDYSSAIDAQYPAHLPQLTNVRSKADLLLLQDRLQKMMHAIDAHDRTQQFTAQAAYGVGPDGRSSFSASSHEQTPDMTPGSSVMSMSPGHSPPADHSPISSAGMLSYPQLQNNLPMSAVSTLGRQYDHNTAQRHGGGYLTRAQPASAHEPETSENATTTTTKTKKSKDPNIDPELAGNKSSSSSSNASGSPTPQPESRRGSGSETSEKQTGLQRDGRIVNNLLKIINSMLENDQFDKENSASPKSQAATSPAPVEAVPATPAADAMDIDKPETDETVTESEVKPEKESEEAAQPSYPTLPSA